MRPKLRRMKTTAIFLVLICCLRVTAAVAPSPPISTTIEEIRKQRPEELQKKAPFRLRAVVCLAVRGVPTVICDGTGGIWVDDPFPNVPSCSVGDLFEIEGFSEAGNF